MLRGQSAFMCQNLLGRHGVIRNRAGDLRFANSVVSLARSHPRCFQYSSMEPGWRLHFFQLGCVCVCLL